MQYMSQLLHGAGAGPFQPEAENGRQIEKNHGARQKPFSE